MRPACYFTMWSAALVLSAGCLLAQSPRNEAIAGPDEVVSPDYLHLWKDCRDDLKRRVDPEDTTLACEKLANAADRFAPATHYSTRRTAYVLYATALTQSEAYGDAAKVSDKAVTMAEKLHDEGAGSGAAYDVRGRARGLAGDFSGACTDLDTAEAAYRKALATASDIFLKTEYVAALKGNLEFHAQILDAMHQTEAAQVKSSEADRL